MSLTDLLNNEKVFIAGAVFLTAANLADMTTFHKAYMFGGLADEGGLFVKYAVGTYGPTAFYTMKASVGGAVLLIAAYVDSKSKAIKNLKKSHRNLGTKLLYFGGAAFSVGAIANSLWLLNHGI